MKRKTNHFRPLLSLLLCAVLLVSTCITAFAVPDASASSMFTLEYYDNYELRCSVLIVTCNEADGFTANNIPAVTITYINQFGTKACLTLDEEGFGHDEQMGYPNLYRQVFEQNGKRYPQFFIRLTDYLPDGTDTPRKLPMTAALDIPAGLFHLSSGAESEALHTTLSKFRRIQFTMELTAEKLRYDNKVVAKKTELTPTLVCDGVCAEAYGALVQYYAYAAPQFGSLDNALTIPFTADGNIDISAAINPCLFCNGFLWATSYVKAYWTGLRDQILQDSWKILPCFLAAIPGMFIVSWPGIWFGPILFSAGVRHLSLLLSSLFAPLTPNTGGFRLSQRGFELAWYHDGLNGYTIHLP